MIIVTFSVRYRAGVDPADIYKLSFSSAVTDALFALKGFVSWDLYKPMVADGTILMIIRFETMEAVRRWRDHSIHEPMIRLGPALMEFYDIQIAQVTREYIWEEDRYHDGNPADFYRGRSAVRPGSVPAMETLFGA